MARKIRFPLQMKGNDVRTIDELRENFDIESILGYYVDGKLATWLRNNYYISEAESVEALSSEDPKINAKLCAIFKIEYSEEENSSDIETAKRRKEKLTLLRQDTTDESLISKVDAIAFDQDDLFDIFDMGTEKTIYLYKGEFEIPLTIKDITYIGIGDPIVYLRAYDNVDFNSLNLKFIDIKYAWDISGTTSADKQRQAEDLMDLGKVKEAIEIMKPLAETGHPRAKYVLYEITESKIYLNNYDIYNQVSTENKYKIAKKLGSKGDKFAQYLEGICYIDGIGVEKDLSKAKEIHSELAKTGHSFAQYYYADGLRFSRYGKKDTDEAIKWSRKASEKNNPRALFQLANMYNNGESVEKNANEAINLFIKSGELCNMHSYRSLGMNFYHKYSDHAIKQDYIEAIRWFNKCISEGYADDWFVRDSHNYLGECYYHGYGVEQDYSKAVEHYKKSNSGLICVGHCYYMGRGVEKSYEKAQEWYEKYIKDESDPSGYSVDRITAIGNMFYHGNAFIDQDYKESIKWYNRGISLGPADSFDIEMGQRILGEYYYYGRGVEQDYSKAIEHFKKGGLYGLIYVGHCYYMGRGVEKSYEKAQEWYEKSI
ncbi:MAG: SEL1-like repeat protein, partial [Firmicutes bacterium]|nr:SEL1-like repeat protein [Bacillota bacterium]